MKLSDVFPDQNKASEFILDEAWLDLKDIETIDVVDSLKAHTQHDADHYDEFLLDFLRKPENLYLTCKLILGVEIMLYQMVIIQELWRHPFNMLLATRGGGKTFLLGLYTLLRLLFLPGRKVLLTGAGFRQSKFIMNYAYEIWQKAPVLRDICNSSGQPAGLFKENDRWNFRIGDSIAVAIPIGVGGDKIRGIRANDIFADEFSSMRIEIFEEVIAPFAVVSDSPQIQVKEAAKRRKMRELGVTDIDGIEKIIQANQLVLSGTPDYYFGHFYKYWNRYKSMISSGNDQQKMKEILGDDTAEHLKGSDFNIIRLPIDKLPEDYMGKQQVAQIKATSTRDIYLKELGACFIEDSHGFFPRSLIQSCVTNEPIVLDGEEIQFKVRLSGTPSREYIMGIDPASEQDNFAVCIIELFENHRRVVYTWTTNRKDFQSVYKNEQTDEQDYYDYCARKILDLFKRFNITGIALDKLGGGVAIEEALRNQKNLTSRELPLLPIFSEKRDQFTDDIQGHHIIHIINFADSSWVNFANYGLKKDMETKTLLFPFFDAVELAVAGLTDLSKEPKDFGYDDLETVMDEIEELKNELTTIIIMKTPAGRERWDTPDLKLPGDRKGNLKKDRYSALLMANAVARERMVCPTYDVNYYFDKAHKQPGGYSAPNWFTSQIHSSIGLSCVRH